MKPVWYLGGFLAGVGGFQRAESESGTQESMESESGIHGIRIRDLRIRVQESLSWVTISGAEISSKTAFWTPNRKHFFVRCAITWRTYSQWPQCNMCHFIDLNMPGALHFFLFVCLSIHTLSSFRHPPTTPRPTTPLFNTAATTPAPRIALHAHPDRIGGKRPAFIPFHVGPKNLFPEC